MLGARPCFIIAVSYQSCAVMCACILLQRRLAIVLQQVNISWGGGVKSLIIYLRTLSMVKCRVEKQLIISLPGLTMSIVWAINVKTEMISHFADLLDYILQHKI